jgi:hypothetical protein
MAEARTKSRFAADASAVDARGSEAREREPAGEVLVEGTPVGFDAMARPVQAGPCRLFMGVRSDPFFADGEGAFHHFQFTGDDTFAGKNILSMALDLPNDMLGLWSGGRSLGNGECAARWGARAGRPHRELRRRRTSSVTERRSLMTDLRRLDELLRAEAGDAGCTAGEAILDAYVELELAGEDPARVFPGTSIHLRSCPGCQADYAGLLEAARHFADVKPE